MKRLIPVLAFVVFQWITPVQGYAITEQDKASDLLSSFAKDFGIKMDGKGPITSIEDLRKRLKGVVDLVSFDKKLKDWLAKREAAADSVKAAEENLTLPNQVREALRQRDENNVKKIDTAIAGIGGRPNPARGQIDTSESEEECPTGNLNQFVNAGDFLSSQGIQQFLADATSFKKDVENRLDEDALAVTLESLKKLKESKKEKKSDQLAAVDLQKKLKDIYTKGPIDRDKLIADLKDETETLTAKKDTLDDKLIDETGTLVKETAKAKKEKGKVTDVAAKWSGMFKGFMQSALTIGQAAIKSNQKACKTADRQLPREVQLAYKVGDEAGINPDEIDQAVEEVKKVNCSMSTAELESAFGSSAQSTADALRTDTDFVTLVSHVKALTDQLSNGLNNATISLNSNHQKCNKAVQEDKGLKEFIAKYGGQGQDGGSKKSGKGRSSSRSSLARSGGRGSRGAGRLSDSSHL